MAKTQIADVIVPRKQMPYIIRRTMELTAFAQAGIIRNDPELDKIAMGAGKTFDLPFWADLSGASEALSDSASLTPAKIGADKDVAVKHFRGKAWQTNDLAGVLAGDDPMAAISELVANYWSRDIQKTVLLNSVAGLFATGGPLALASANPHAIDISRATAGTAVNTNMITGDTIVDACGTLGDAWENIVGMAVHSKVFQDFQKQGLIAYVSMKDQNIQVPTYLGRMIITDDGLPVTVPGGGIPNKYTSYLFGAGAFGFGDGTPTDGTALETDRDKLAGDDLLVSRRHFIMHPRGVAFTGTPAGVTPTTAELATGANWTLKWEHKAIGIVAVTSNAGWVRP